MLKSRLYFKGMFIKTTIKINMTEEELKQKFGNSKEDIINREKYLLTCSVNIDTIAQGQLAILTSYDLIGKQFEVKEDCPRYSRESIHYDCDYLKPDGTFGTMRWLPREYFTMEFKLNDFNLSHDEFKKLLARSFEVTNLKRFGWIEYIARVR